MSCAPVVLTGVLKTAVDHELEYLQAVLNLVGTYLNLGVFRVVTVHSILFDLPGTVPTYFEVLNLVRPYYVPGTLLGLDTSR